MESISAEKKLELIKNIREEHAKNRGSIKQRERILFGEENTYYSSMSPNITDASKNSVTQDATSSNGLKIRFFLAVLLFLAFMIMDIGKISIKGIDANIVQTKMNQTFSTNIFDFMSNIPYTLTEELVSKDQ